MDNDDGIVLDHSVERGNPADAPQLVPAVTRVIARTGRRPRTVTADRGYGEARVENSLHELGVRTATIPRKADPAKPARHSSIARRSAETSSGAPAARPGSAPSNDSTDGTEPRLDDLDGARIWAGHGVLAHNLVKIAALSA